MYTAANVLNIIMFIRSLRMCIGSSNPCETIVASDIAFSLNVNRSIRYANFMPGEIV